MQLLGIMCANQTVIDRVAGAFAKAGLIKPNVLSPKSGVENITYKKFHDFLVDTGADLNLLSDDGDCFIAGTSEEATATGINVFYIHAKNEKHLQDLVTNIKSIFDMPSLTAVSFKTKSILSADYIAIASDGNCSPFIYGLDKVDLPLAS